MSVTMESQDRDMAEEFWDDLMKGDLFCGARDALAWKFAEHRQDTEAAVRAEYAPLVKAAECYRGAVCFACGFNGATTCNRGGGIYCQYADMRDLFAAIDNLKK